MKNSLFLLITILCSSCGDEQVPKPKAFLRLDYPEPKYTEVSTNLPFTFERNSLAKNLGAIKISSDQNTLGIEINYPSIKGTIFLTYKKINKSNLKRYIIDAQNITQTHSIRAEVISGQPFENFKNKVYGMLYEVEGNVASQAQFYVTDSINHFLVGAVYFYAKPNYDSIFPAANYLKQDIRHLMETLKWK